VLTRSRALAISVTGLACLLAGGAAAPAASAAPAAPLARAGTAALTHHRVGLPAGAGKALLHELQSAWQISKGGGVIIAVLSTGVESVNGLSGKLINGPDYAKVANPVLTDGTVLASIIAGSGPTFTGPSGSIGRAPAARILSVRIVAYGSGASGRKYQASGTWEDLEAKAIRYAVRHGAKVIVTQESGTEATQSLASAVAYAVARNVVIVTPNLDFHMPNDYPDDFPGVINITGAVLKGLPTPPKRAHFAVGPSVLVTAPSNTSYATGPGSQSYYAWGDYTTLAWAAGTVALIKSVYPTASPAVVDRALAMSASDHPAGGYNTTIGFGLINPIGALRAVRQLRGLHLVAAPGPQVMSTRSHFGSGPPPGTISAVRHAPVKLAGFSAAVAAGLALLVIAFVLMRRLRRASRRAVAGDLAEQAGAGTS
jgi:hypothetical protein